MGGRLLALALPPRCLACGVIVLADDTLCHDCWARLTFIGAPRCAACGVPFELDAGDGSLCGACIASPPTFDAARAAVIYDELPRRLLMRFKYGGREHSARLMARHMRMAGGDWLDDDRALLVPVPLGRWRLWRRGYNQAALLARALGRDSAAFPLLDALVRTRETRASGGLGRRQRQANVRGAFAVAEHAVPRIAGRPVILVDDVITTGATCSSCATALRRAGAGLIHVLGWARAVTTDMATDGAFAG